MTPPPDEDALDAALAAWLVRREAEPALLPSDFAVELPEELRSAFLRELESLAAIDVLASAPPRDLPQRFGDFRILGRLGQGATGVVYEAEQVSLRRRVAIKVLHAHVASDPRHATRFRREAQTAAALHHPAIVPVHAVGECDGQTFLVMGLVTGRSLQRLLQAFTDPRDLDHARAQELLGDRDRVLATLAEAADALHYAHERGVVHRDVKPANLLIDDEGHVLVLDFGLATTLFGDDATLTRTGDVLGTPIYMAPEQAAGEREVDGRADIYSLGAILYECLSGRTTVAPAPLPVLLERIRNAAPAPLATLVPALPRDVVSVVMRCLEKQRTRRYANAAALATDLRRLVAREPVTAKPVGTFGKIVRHVERRPRAWAAAALLAVIAAGAGALTWRSAARVGTLERAREHAALRVAMSTTPEGIRALGGASLKWYRTLGLCEVPEAAGDAVSERARDILGRAVALAASAPDDAESQRLVASLGIDIGSREALAAATAAFGRLEALGLEPRDHALRAVLGLIVGNETAAARDFAASAGSSAPEAHFARGLWHQIRQDYEASIREFDRALESSTLGDEHRYFALLHRGWCRTCEETRDLVRAKDDLHSAMALRPDYATPRLLWGGLRLLEPDEGVVDPTLQEVTRVLAKVDHAPWVLRLTACVLLAFAEGSAERDGPSTFLVGLTPLAPVKVEATRRDALVATALVLLEKLGPQLEDDPDATMLRLVGAALQGRIADAERDAQRIARANPALATLLRAKLALQDGRSGDAWKLLESAAAATPRQANTSLLRADLAARRGDAKAELAALRHAISALPADAPFLPRLQDRMLRNLLSTGALDDAAQTLADPRFLAAGCGGQGTFARKMRATHAESLARARAGHALTTIAATTRPDAKQIELALARFPVGREAAPDRLVERAALLFAAGRSVEAGEDLRRALARDPEDLRVRALLAVVLARSDARADARAMLRDPEGRPRLEAAHVGYLASAFPAALDPAWRAEVVDLLE